MENLSPDFFKKLISMCNRIGVPPADMLLIFTLESGLNPHSITKNTVGLNQFYGENFKKYFKGTREQYAALPAEDQLGPIESFLKGIIGNKNINSAAQLYCANFLPISLNFPGVIRKDRSTILAKKDSKETYSSNNELTYGAVYEANSGLDLNGDNLITYGDLEDMLMRKTADPRYQMALKQLSEISRSQQQSTTDPSAAATVGTESSNQAINTGDMDIVSFISMVIDGMKQFMSGLVSLAEEENNFLIKIASPNLEDNLEIARILSTAYEDLLGAQVKTYTNGDSVEVSCNIINEDKNCFAAVEQFSKATLEEFSNQIKSNHISLHVFANKKPLYNELDIKTAEANYRKFQLKILRIKNG